MASDNKTDVFSFMSLRAPQLISANRLGYSYVHDETIVDGGGERRKQREVFSMQSSSGVGKVVYTSVFASNAGNPEEINQEIIQGLLALLEARELVLQPGQGSPLINDLEKYSYLQIENTFYLLPSKLEAVVTGVDLENLLAAKKLIQKHCHSFNRKALIEGLNTIFSEESFWKVVFYSKHIYEPKFIELKAKLFDTLYLLYILRRKVSVNLEDIISALQVMHALEYLAIDSFLYAIYKGKISLNNDPEALSYFNFFQTIFPELAGLNPSTSSSRFYYVKDKEDLNELFQASPIVHPIVAELAHYGKPRFNNIKPYLGDLKVVKQWLLGYKCGEISFIHNVMKGEEKERNHRYLEKTEEVFSYTSEASQSTQTEAGATERFELKREAESVIKTDINAGANANMTYKYGEVFTASLGANFAYANSNQDSQKSASNYAREVMSKAVTNIQSRSSTQRSISKLYEKEEKNNHKFTNTQVGATHISGIYRWLDKKYKAQLYNFGQRWMFEFTIPEPASFYATSKLKAAEFDYAVLQKPNKPDYEKVRIIKPGTQSAELLPADIDENTFNTLRLKYDLVEFTFPEDSFWMPFTDKQKGNNDLSRDVRDGWAGNMVWTSSQFRSSIPKGYDITAVSIVGNVQFVGSGDNLNEHWELNKLLFMLNGHNIKDIRDDSLENSMEVEYLQLDEVLTISSPIQIFDGEVILDLNFQDLARFTVMAYLSLKINGDFLLSWKTQVYNKIKIIEETGVNKRNQELEIVYNSQLADYNNKLDDLRAKNLNDIIQGRSESYNAQIIAEELKKHCITMITKEFDIGSNNDLLSNTDALQNSSVDISYEKFAVEEVDEVVGTSPNTKTVTTAFAGFKEITDTVNYPKIDIEKANMKARYIQFLEQAFEWQHLAYMFQPYFWAHESKWIKLMNRLDYTDNNMTAFLKAGSARVVIAVTPGYYNAVMHFLATREPWEGGPLPVIGDPLFIPIYDEIRNKQDDLENAIPEGPPWEFELPTSLIYLQDSSSPIPEDLLYDKPVTP